MNCYALNLHIGSGAKLTLAGSHDRNWLAAISCYDARQIKQLGANSKKNTVL